MRIALSLLLLALPLSAAKKPTVAQLEVQVKRLTGERDELKLRLSDTEPLQQELTSAKKGRDQAKAEADAARKEADQLRTTLKENLGGSDALLKELEAAKQAAQEAQAEAARLKGENEILQRKAEAVPREGDLVPLGEEIQGARPINLNRATPRFKPSGLFNSRPKGVVVVNVLISEKGDVLAARLLQGLPGDAPDYRAVEEACVEAAKHIVFDPASSRDGKTRFKVWQGVGFYLD
jgi:multidrug efflux pump subunit AcrA (membrane-fusion protein)